MIALEEQVTAPIHLESARGAGRVRRAGTPVPQREVSAQHAEAGQRLVSTGDTGATTMAPGKLAPSRVDLVEQFESGKLYLRAFVDGHFLWQPVAGAIDAIPDAGIWMTGSDFHDAYWINHGTYRRRSGRYYPLHRAMPVMQAT